MALSPRARFEVFKRDGFTCRYCGRQSPDVVLEVDHVVPKRKRGRDDSMNLVTSCWECNRGKSGVPLDQILTGEDPHDKAIAILEQERQLKEYDAVLAAARDRREEDAWELLRYWKNDDELNEYPRCEFTWLVTTLGWLPKETLREYMDAAYRAEAIYDLRYVKGCVRNAREKQQEAAANG
jgi:hypothetical protein